MWAKHTDHPKQHIAAYKYGVAPPISTPPDTRDNPAKLFSPETGTEKFTDCHAVSIKKYFWTVQQRRVSDVRKYNLAGSN